MSNKPKTKNRSQTEIFPTVADAIGSVNGDDRIKTLIYAFKKALEAGKIKGGNDFDTEAAIAALEKGRLQLRGNQNQIAGQLVLIRGATSMLRRALDYAVSDASEPIQLPSDDENRPRPQPIKSEPGPRR